MEVQLKPSNQTTMNTLRTSEYSDRSPYRRKIDTMDRLMHFVSKCSRQRINRQAIMEQGLRMLDRECEEATHNEVRETLRAMFSGFDPLAEVNKLSIRKPFNAEAHGHLLVP